MTAIRLTQRQVQALWRDMYVRNSAGLTLLDIDKAGELTRDEMLDLEARLYVAAHPELVQHVIELDVRGDDRDALVRVDTGRLR